MRTATFDLATGELIHITDDAAPGLDLHPGLSGAEGARVAAAVLPGATPELVDEWYGAWLEADTAPGEPVPFAVGSTVAHREASTMRGKVTKRVVNGGELHTIWVSWTVSSGQLAAEAYSPSELVQA